MSSILLAGVPVILLAAGYIFYSPRLERWLGIDRDQPTPAAELNDGVDYVPAKHWTVLFGHHFASIAGAAPIIGPVMACMYWGWLPALIWIVVGGVLFGAMHDFTALTLSVKHRGVSVATITESVLGKGARIVFSLFVMLALILVVAVFAAIAGKTLATTPAVVIPTFGLMFVAVITGTMMYRLRWNTAVCTIAGLAMLAGLIVLGARYPISLGPCPVGEVVRIRGMATAVDKDGRERQLAAGSPLYGRDVIHAATAGKVTVRFQRGKTDFVENGGMLAVGRNVYGIANVKDPHRWWTVILLVYGLVASVTPVTILLQPRDHLAAGVLFVGMLAGFAGLLITHPAVNAPPFVAYSTAKGPLWPMLFVIIACGAISGFHSLVAGGTTSKQLPRMRDARAIGYGGMILESALSVLAVVAVTAGLYWVKAPEGEAGLVYQDVLKTGGEIKAFGEGYGVLTDKLLWGYGALVGITMLKTFVMTTLDSATRITRYVCTELLGESLNIKPLKNKYLATLAVGIPTCALALGKWQAIWPIFGSANQLIASLVLIVAGVYLLTRGMKSAFAVIPGFIMLATSVGALVYQAQGFVRADKPKIMLASAAFVLIALAGFILVRSIVVFARMGSGKAIGTAAS